MLPLSSLSIFTNAISLEKGLIFVLLVLVIPRAKWWESLKKKRQVTFLFHSCLFIFFRWADILFCMPAFEILKASKKKSYSPKWFFSFRKFLISISVLSAFEVLSDVWQWDFFFNEASVYRVMSLHGSLRWRRKKLWLDTGPGNHTLTLDFT